MTLPPESLPALGFLLSPGTQRIVKADTHSEAGIFLGHRAERAPQILQLLRLGAAAFAGSQVIVKLTAGLFQRSAPVIDELCSCFFAIHDAFSPASSK